MPITIHNPHTGQSIRTFGIIDTGADECAIPGKMASRLGHTLEKGKAGSSKTGGGLSECYAHTTSIDIFHPQKGSAPAYRLENIPVDFMPDLDVVLLGVRNFLSEFILAIDYPRYEFSIKRPIVDRRDTP